MALTDDVTFPLDGSGKPAAGAQSDATGFAFPVKGDEDIQSMHMTMYRWNTSTTAWEKWDGRMDTVVSGDLIVAVDDLEDLVDAGNTIRAAIQAATEAIQAQKEAEQEDYKLSDWVESGTDVYVGYLKADGAWIIKKFDTLNGQVRYVSGASGYDFSDPASLSYDLYSTEF